MHAVHVFEPYAPDGEEPIESLLLTSDVVDSLESAARVVDHYRARWVIEEYFKALKTGCAFEKRQLTSYASLLRALTIFIPMAWRLLALRHAARSEPSMPAKRLFDGEQLRVIRFLLEQRRSDYRLPAQASVRDAMLASPRSGDTSETTANLGGSFSVGDSGTWYPQWRNHPAISEVVLKSAAARDLLAHAHVDDARVRVEPERRARGGDRSP